MSASLAVGPMHYGTGRNQRSSSFGRWANDYETRNDMHIPFAQLMEEEDEEEYERKSTPSPLRNSTPLKTYASYEKDSKHASTSSGLGRRHSGEAAKKAQELSSVKVNSKGTTFRLPKKGVNFIVKFVGRDKVVVGNDAFDNSQQAVAMLQSTTDESLYKRVSLRISSTLVTVTEEITNTPVTSIPIHRISQCRWNPYDPCVFSFVAFEKQLKEYFCYVFYSQTESAGEINKIFGQAFRDAYEDAVRDGGYTSQKTVAVAASSSTGSPSPDKGKGRRESTNPFDSLVAPRTEYQTENGIVSSTQLDAFAMFAKGGGSSSQSGPVLSSSQLDEFNRLSLPSNGNNNNNSSKRSSYSSVKNKGVEIPTTDDLIQF